MTRGKFRELKEVYCPLDFKRTRGKLISKVKVICPLTEDGDFRRGKRDQTRRDLHCRGKETKEISWCLRYTN